MGCPLCRVPFNKEKMKKKCQKLKPEKPDGSLEIAALDPFGDEASLVPAGPAPDDVIPVRVMIHDSIIRGSVSIETLKLVVREFKIMIRTMVENLMIIFILFVC